MRRLVCVCCVQCGCLAPTCFNDEPAKMSTGVHILEFSSLCSAATLPPARLSACYKNVADDWMNREDSGC